MKRYGYILQQAAEYDNVSDSFDYHVCGEFKNTRYGKFLVEHREETIAKLQKLILDGTLEPGEYLSLTINERGKTREIQMIRMFPTIGIHAIMTVVEKYIDASLIADTAASIKGRGGVYLLKRILKDFRENFEDCHYIYKDDIQKFYQNIPQDAVMDLIHRKFKDKKLIVILEKFIRLLDSGLSIGMRPSQGFANLYLSAYVDHLLKDVNAVKYYRRYCDDRVLQASSYYELTNAINIMKEGTDKAQQTVKKSAQCFDLLKRPLDFLGYVIYGNGQIKIRKHIKQRFARHWKRVKSFKRKQQLIGSFYGIAKHAHSKNLFKRITGISMATFSSLGYVHKDKQGRKVFDLEKVSITELVGVEVKLLDFETLPQVRNYQGERLIIKVELTKDCELGPAGKQVKTWTGSEILRDQMTFLKKSAFETMYKKLVTEGTDFGTMTKEQITEYVKSKISIKDLDIVTTLVKTQSGGYRFE